MTQKHRRPIIWGVIIPALALAVLGLEAPARADLVYDVSVNTSGALINGQTGYIDFQFNAQGTPTATGDATATVDSFATNGTLGAVLPPTSGHVSGALPGPLTLSNADPTPDPANEITYNLTFGTTITFQVTLAGPAIGAANNGSTFAFTLFDNTTPIPLAYSTGPGGSAVTIDIHPDGSTSGTAYDPVAPGGPTATVSLHQPATVPEPATLVPMGLGLIALVGWSRRRRAA